MGDVLSLDHACEIKARAGVVAPMVLNQAKPECIAVDFARVVAALSRSWSDYLHQLDEVLVERLPG